MRNRRLHRRPERGPAAHRRPEPPGVPRLRLGRHRRARPAPASRPSAQAAPSAGCATLEAALPKRLTGTAGIGHTRWATHGPATEANAHPHAERRRPGQRSCTTASSTTPPPLRAQLQAAGVELRSDTDTEVLAHLIARSSADTLEGAVRRRPRPGDRHLRRSPSSTPRHPDRIVVARNGSPADPGHRRARDVRRLRRRRAVRHTTPVVHLDDGELATVTANGYRTFTTRQRPTPAGLPVDDRPGRRGPTSSAATSTTCTRRSSSSRTPPRAVLRGRLDERFGTARLDGLNLDAARAARLPPGEDPRLRLGLLRGPDRAPR